MGMTQTVSETPTEAAVPWYRALGPGVLLAGAAIGGSHIVWSTRAGAMHGWSLLWIVLAVNLLKYPFFRYAQRYTAATGQSLVAGYAGLGRGWLWLFALVSAPLAVVIIAGVGLLTGALVAIGLHGLDADVLGTVLPTAKHVTAGILVACIALISFGRYHWLERCTKVVIAVLAVTTIIGAVVALGADAPPAPEFTQTALTLAFVVAVMGWMPAPIDITVWSSLWMVSRGAEQGRRIQMREAMTDFNIGYVITAALVIPFLAMGALVMHGAVHPVASKGIGFCHQLLGAYQATLGSTAMVIVLIAAAATMLSTTLTCVDGYGRSLAASIQTLRRQSGESSVPGSRSLMIVVMVVVCGAAMLLFYLSVGNLLSLLKWAAVISFLTSPLFGLLNVLVMTKDPLVPDAVRPGGLMRAVSWLSLAVMVAIGLTFVIVSL